MKPAPEQDFGSANVGLFDSCFGYLQQVIPGLHPAESRSVIAPDGLSCVVNFTGGFTSARYDLCHCEQCLRIKHSALLYDQCSSGFSGCDWVQLRFVNLQTSVTYTSSSVCFSNVCHSHNRRSNLSILSDWLPIINCNCTKCSGSCEWVMQQLWGASQPGTLGVSNQFMHRTAADEMTADFAGELSAYPNPTSGKATVEFTST